jgi:hypothetical protein
MRIHVFVHAEDTDATNELIYDNQLVQPLTLADIEELKCSGAHASVRSVPADMPYF